MNLDILNYPHASFDIDSGCGFLCHYYPYSPNPTKDQLDQEAWKNKTYSGEILNFKEGQDRSISYFVEPFAKLIEFAIEHCKESPAVLVPVPSSVSKDDSAFSNIPYDKKTMSKRKNRDNRLEIFCKKLVQAKTKLHLETKPIILRKTSKTEKTKGINLQQKTLDFVAKFKELKTSSMRIYVLIDDVETTGNTFNECVNLLKENLRKQNIDNPKIFRLSIGKTKSHAEFQPVNKNFKNMAL
jgi:predicted amidophosphoribosyltransferase